MARSDMYPIPVLTYHGFNIFGDTYETNDHIAFAEDLKLVTELGWTIQPLAEIVDAFQGNRPSLPTKTIGITFDDGTDFDFSDLVHPQWGQQRSLLNIMRDFSVANPNAQAAMHATSFVIASPDARDAMDRKCLFGHGWMSEAWWQDAISSSLMGVGNHSWDHTHEAVAHVAQRDQRKGDFHCVDTQDDADAQIRRAAEYLNIHAPNPAASLFCYPYGHVNDFLRQTYFPNQLSSSTPFVRAAFSTQAGAINQASDRWNLPRYVCGWHWKSISELRDLLSDIRD